MSSGQTLGQAKYNRTIAGTPPSAGVFRLDTARTRKVRKEKEKKMGWFKRKFAQWTREAWESAQKAEVYATDSVRPHEGLNGKTSVRFTIYPASGGFVIEHYKQDRFKDGDGPSLTIVNSSEDIGQAVEHILAIEALKA
jgi:hypothetical protein